mmetsp:Transcript_43358/g.68647  ORF Transcript_43358/g.68647 Transcript_43358/m.68647 type:complete len:129 (-) Transcript_43358:120-506(-)
MTACNQSSLRGKGSAYRSCGRVYCGSKSSMEGPTIIDWDALSRVFSLAKDFVLTSGQTCVGKSGAEDDIDHLQPSKTIDSTAAPIKQYSPGSVAFDPSDGIMLPKAVIYKIGSQFLADIGVNESARSV